MKKRIFSEMDNGVFRIVVKTEEWSQGDLEKMTQFGEPEIDVGGTITYIINSTTKTKTFGNEFVRILHGFPYSRGFDSKDYASTAEAIAVGTAWKEAVNTRINTAVTNLRALSAPLTTEEVSTI